jgi:DNA invertase Pin-like site-specific DNA recombinase
LSREEDSHRGQFNFRFFPVDHPDGADPTVSIIAFVDLQEREAISRRTKEALAAAKARGVKLGNPNGAVALRRAGEGGVALRQAVTSNADAFALTLAQVLGSIRAEGHASLRAIAAELNAHGIRTRRGGRWHVSNVRNLLARLARLAR